MSAVTRLFGENAKASVDKCVRVEDQKEVWEEAQQIGQQIRLKIQAEK